MYAIVEISGQQFKVEQDQEIFVHKLGGNSGDTVTFDKVLLKDNSGKIAVGTPTVSNSKVTGTIIEHLKGDKVLVFKKKRRKGYRQKNGHRQQFTKVKIDEIV